MAESVEMPLGLSTQAAQGISTRLGLRSLVAVGRGNFKGE